MKQPIVNYVWIQFYGEEINPIPSHLFYYVQRNAKRYPITQFIVWVQDPSVIGSYHVPQNVEIHTLEEIKSFYDTPVMKLAGKQYGWAKVDAAKLFVIHHILENEEAPVIYSDMDVKDVRAKSRHLRSRLIEYGVAIGATYTLRSYTSHIERRYDNGYMAFTKDAKDLLKTMIDACGQIGDYGTRNAIHDCQFDVLDKWARTKGISNWLKTIACFPVLPPNNYVYHAPRAELR